MKPGKLEEGEIGTYLNVFFRCVVVYPHAPLNLSALTTEGQHGPDGRQHLFRHSSGFGVGRLLFIGEGRKHLPRRGRRTC